MKTLHFRTNIDCPFRLLKATCGLECLRGKYCHFIVDLVEQNHILTIKATTYQSVERLPKLQRRLIRLVFEQLTERLRMFKAQFIGDFAHS